jgi:hypothetical protein
MAFLAPRWRNDSPAWPLWIAGALVALLAAMAIALGVARLAGPALVDEAGEAPAPAGLVLGSERRCLHCGRIESKRKVPPGTTDPQALAVYEYTVRMTDGSSSIFEQALPASWRVGERLTVIGVARPLD